MPTQNQRRRLLNQRNERFKYESIFSLDFIFQQISSITSLERYVFNVLAFNLLL